MELRNLVSKGGKGEREGGGGSLEGTGFLKGRKVFNVRGRKMQGRKENSNCWGKGGGKRQSRRGFRKDKKKKGKADPRKKIGTGKGLREKKLVVCRIG